MFMRWRIVLASAWLLVLQTRPRFESGLALVRIHAGCENKCLVSSASKVWWRCSQHAPNDHIFGYNGQFKRTKLHHTGLQASLSAEPLSHDTHLQWWGIFIALLVLIVGFYTALDCVLDPNIEYPWGVARIAAPTALLVAPGAAVSAASMLRRLPHGPKDCAQGCSVVFVGDSLTQGTLSANFLNVLTQRWPQVGKLVNMGMNMRPAVEALDGQLLNEASSLRPKHGVVVLLGTNDLIRYTQMPEPFRQPAEAWLISYEKTMANIVRRLQQGGVEEITLASPPLLGEDLTSHEGVLGKKMAAVVRKVASTLPGCRYAPVYEAVASHIKQAESAGALASQSRAYSWLESVLLLCALPWRLYALQTPLKSLQEEQGLELTVDLIHYGPRFAEIAANVFEDTLKFESADLAVAE